MRVITQLLLVGVLSRAADACGRLADEAIGAAIGVARRSLVGAKRSKASPGRSKASKKPSKASPKRRAKRSAKRR